METPLLKALGMEISRPLNSNLKVMTSLRRSRSKSSVSKTESSEEPGARGKSPYQGKTRADFFNAQHSLRFIEESPDVSTTSQQEVPRPALPTRPKQQKFKDEMTYDQLLREAKFPWNNVVLEEATGEDFDESGDPIVVSSCFLLAPPADDPTKGYHQVLGNIGVTPDNTDITMGGGNEDAHN